MVTDLVAGYLASMLAKQVAKLAAPLYCVMALFELAEVPNTIEGVMGAWGWMTTTFEEPTCKDLNFDE